MVFQSIVCTTTPAERIHPQQIQQTGTATLMELTSTIQLLNARYHNDSVARQIGTRLEPLISFVERYAKSLDILSQGIPLASIIWGALRVLLETASSASRYFHRIIDMLETLGSQVCLYAQYEDLFRADDYFATALISTHLEIIEVLRKACHVLQKSGFILVVRALWRNFESDFKESLDSLSRRTKCLDDVITYSHRRDVNQHLLMGLAQQSEMKWHKVDPVTSSDISDKMRVDVLDWLAPPNVSADLLTHSAKSLSGTGTWIFEEPQFCDWRDRNETSVLWVCGAPGTGKTVLGAQVVQHFANLDVSEECSTTFYFFDKSIRPERPLEVLAAAIMSQIVHQSRSLDTVVVSAYETSQRFGRSRMSYLDDPFRLLKAMAAKLGRLNIILDGLDECDNGEEILLAVKGLLASAANIHIAVFSRDVPWIRIHMGCAAAIELNSSRNRSDMTHYVQKSIARLMLDDPTLEAKIADIVTRKADGMFLWTACVMENLRSATNPIEALEVLDLLPPGIDAYYNSCLYRLSQDHVRRRGLAENMLRWMCCSGRPLSWPEVRSCLGLANEADQQEGLHFPFQSVVLDVCAPFIKLDAITATFRFQHNSAREFLLQKTKASDAGRFCVDEAETHQSLAHICLRQLLSQERDANFTQYATQYWLDHLLQATWNIDLQNLVRKLVGDSAVMEKWFIDRIRWDEQRGFSMSKILGSQPLLNDWMRSTAHSKQTQELDWTKSLVHTLLRLDEDGEYCGHGYQALRLSHLENLMIVRDLARVLTQSRRIDEGITWFKAALCHRKKQEAAQAAHCWILSALGILYDQRNDIRGSLDIHSHVLSVQELELGQQSLETIWTVNELGRVYRHLGNFDKAEEHHRRALKVLLEILPDDHLEVVWTMNTLARSYRKSGRITEALALHRTALAGQERALGVTHPHPLWTRGDIGKCYHGLGLVREAEEFHRASLTGRLSVLGAAHVDTLWSMAKVGQVLSTRKQYEEAGDLLQRALKGQISSLGDQNSQTIKTAMALQNLLSVQGNHSRMHMSEEGLRL